MDVKTPVEIVEALRIAFETRSYNDFVNLFAEDGIYELPFALEGSPSHYEGIEKIRARFGNALALNTMNKLFELHKVHAAVQQGADANQLTVELSIEGKNYATDKSFTLSSSIAVIRFKDGKITNYRDYPNSTGFAAAVGMLSQFAASLVK